MTERLTTRERRENRAARRRDWQGARERRADQSRAELRSRVDELPENGQPILVGHHSERRHRNAIARVDRAHERVRENDAMADKHRSAAAAIERELDRSIYSDDADAIERLEERIAGLEAERERIKAINANITRQLKGTGIKRRHLPFDAPEEQRQTATEALQRARVEMEMSDKEVRDMAMAMQHSMTIGYPSYALSNLSGNLSRQRKRLAQLRKKS